MFITLQLVFRERWRSWYFTCFLSILFSQDYRNFKINFVKVFGKENYYFVCHLINQFTDTVLGL